MCGCRKAGLKCPAVCLHCSGETCTKIMKITKLIEENEFEELPTNTSILTPVIPHTFTFDVELESESQPGPSKKSKMG
ncbi:unnamed protein product [Pieris macdunnoughi]|uniref:Uncharacterized protein n=1 Tax=Pieris macdunnoughi TaxID=345717 RepID=A0A821MMF7_9NEOP|nr:unnamed protein product [Pieris macdunnoughi]